MSPAPRHLAEHGHQVQGLIGLALLDKLGVPGERFQEIVQRQFIVRGVFELLLEHSEVVRGILRCRVHRMSMEDCSGQRQFMRRKSQGAGCGTLSRAQ